MSYIKKKTRPLLLPTGAHWEEWLNGTNQINTLGSHVYLKTKQYPHSQVRWCVHGHLLGRSPRWQRTHRADAWPHAHEPSVAAPAAGHDGVARVCSHLTHKWRHMEMLKGEEVVGFSTCIKYVDIQIHYVWVRKHVTCMYVSQRGWSYVASYLNTSWWRATDALH